MTTRSASAHEALDDGDVDPTPVLHPLTSVLLLFGIVALIAFALYLRARFETWQAPLRGPVLARHAAPGFDGYLVALTGGNIAAAVLWLASAPLFFIAARATPIERDRWRQGVAVTAALVAALAICAAYAEYVTEFGGSDLAPPVGEFLRVQALRFLVPFIALAALALAYESRRVSRRRAELAARLRVQLLDAQLQSLTAQLHPHFLFNTLQGVSTLMHRDVLRADEMLGRLSTLLRASLAQKQGEVTLGRELDLAREYAAIVALRLDGGLVVTYEIDPRALAARVPFFLLQPLIENAVTHGTHSSGGRLTIAATVNQDTLTVAVTDEATGNVEAGSGTGLANTRHRLRGLYGPLASLSLTVGAEGSTATVTMPFREAAALT